MNFDVTSIVLWQVYAMLESVLGVWFAIDSPQTYGLWVLPMNRKPSFTNAAFSYALSTIITVHVEYADLLIYLYIQHNNLLDHWWMNPNHFLTILSPRVLKCNHLESRGNIYMHMYKGLICCHTVHVSVPPMHKRKHMHAIIIMRRTRNERLVWCGH